VTITIESFVGQARAFLDAHAKVRKAEVPGGGDDGEAAEGEGAEAEGASQGRPLFVWGEGDDTVAVVEEKDPASEQRALAEAKAWAALRFDAGFGWIDGPIELGGRGLTAAHWARGRAGSSG
jgi:hypothetical protein